MVSPPSSLQNVDAPDACRLARLGETALAFALGLGLLYAMVLNDIRESTVVSIADLDVAIVLSLASIDFAAPGVVDVDARPDAVSTPAAGEGLPPAPVASWPSRLRHMIVERSGANGVADALATVVGIASTYNPFSDASQVEVQPTASGEAYDPDTWTAAIQIDLRDRFHGVRYGRFYRPAFALVERGDKRAIVKINDVGPLRPGRVIDLNERSMRYFDPTLRLGLVHDVKITLLPGDDWMPGPVSGDKPVSIASAD